MGKNGHNKKENGPWHDMGKNEEKKKKMSPNPICSSFLGPFFPPFGPWAIAVFLPFFCYFRLSARIPFYARRSHSQSFTGGFGGKTTRTPPPKKTRKWIIFGRVLNFLGKERNIEN